MPPRVLVLGVDGTMGSSARCMLNEMQTARDDEGTRGGDDGGPSLRAELAVALARVEAATYGEWRREVGRKGPLVAAAAAAGVAAGAVAEGSGMQ